MTTQATRPNTDRVFAWITLGGAVLMLIGPFLPWAYDRGYPITMLADGPKANTGLLALFLALALLAFGIARLTQPLRFGARMTQLALVGLFGLVLFIDFYTIYVQRMEVGPGITAAMLGAMLGLAGAFPLSRR